MKYYLVDINEDMSAYEYCLVYYAPDTAERPTVYLSTKTLAYICASCDVSMYRSLVIDVSDEDLVIMQLRGTVEHIDTARITNGAKDRLVTTSSEKLV